MMLGTRVECGRTRDGRSYGWLRACEALRVRESLQEQPIFTGASRLRFSLGSMIDTPVP